MSIRRTMATAMMLALLGMAASASDVLARPAGLRGRFQPVSLGVKTAEDLPAPSPDATKACCPKPCITYRHKGPKLCCGCDPPVETVLKVKDPCRCYETEIPLCMPACCKGEPTVCWTSGAFCRDVAIYEWCCGFKVRVTFKHCGDLLVTTWGR